MIISELRKLWKKKSFLGLLVFALLCNVGLSVYQDEKETIPLAAYHAFDKRLKAMSEQEKEKYVKDYYERVKGLCLVEQIQNMQAVKSEQVMREMKQLLSENKSSYQSYYPEWKEGNYLTYCTTLDEEEVFAEDIYQRFQKVNQYETYLDEVCERAENQSEISIFANSKADGHREGKDSFNRTTAFQTADQYEKLRGTVISFYSYEWINRVLNSRATELLWLLMLFLVVWQMFYEEKKKGLFLVMRTMPGGRTKLCIAKLAALVVNTTLVSLLLYSSVALYYSIRLGIPRADASIQSVAVCQSCPYRITVGQYVCLLFFVRILALLAFAHLLFLVENLAGHVFWMFLTGVGSLVGSMALYYLVSAVSKRNWLHFSNYYSWFHVEDMLIDYRNLSLGGHPVTTFNFVMVEMIVFIVITALAAVFFFCRKRHDTIHCIPKLHKRKKQVKIHTCLWKYELTKILVVNRGGVMLILFLLVSGIRMVNFDCYQTPNELRYRWQMKELKGSLTKEKQLKIIRQKTEYEKIQKAIRELKIQRAKGEITKEEEESQKLLYESQLAFLPAFLRVYQRYTYILEHPNAEFVYEEGYNKIFGRMDGGHLYMFLILNGVMVLLLAPVFASDRERGMDCLLYTTPRGREDSGDARIFVSGGLVSLMYAGFMISIIVQAIRGYGLPQCWAPISSLAGFEQYPDWMPIVLVVVGYILLQWFFLMIFTAFFLWFSKKIGNTLHAIIWGLVLFVMPGIIYALFHSCNLS